MRKMAGWQGALLVGLLLAGLSGCTTTRENLGSDVTGALQPFAQGSRTGPCGERYSAEEGMELSMVQQQLDEERPRSALAYLEALGYAYPEARLMEAEALRQVGELERSSEVYAALRSTCLEADAQRGLARNAFSRQRPEVALEYMRRARQASPADARIRNDLGYLLMLRGDHSAAIEEFLTALELDESHGNAASNLVLALLQSGQPRRAEAAAQRYRLDSDAFATLQAAVARSASLPAAPGDTSHAQESQDETP
ncbi:tetratricopeptide repeat protein [Halomonas mongoliensis]|uniref:tetratricopeptide repeat protein n=1 Tax=Halomonas mongoliensis TaxID=321265 RepID=UPI00403AD7CE